MGLFSFLTRKRLLICDCCGKAASNETNYCITTSQLIKSNKYWDFVMTKPNMVEISRLHFSGDANATRDRGEVIIGIVQSTTNWCICENCIDYFEVDKALARKYAIKKGNDPTFTPPNSGDPRSILSFVELDFAVRYAIRSAGYDYFNK